MIASTCAPRAVVIGAALILPAVMATGLVWWLVFFAFSEHVAEAGFFAGLLLAPPVAAFVTARSFGGTWCTGAFSGVLFVATVVTAGAFQPGELDVYDAVGYALTAGVFGAAGGLLGSLHPFARGRSGRRERVQKHRR